VTSREPVDLCASVHGRLRQRFHRDGGDYGILLPEFAAERFLYRLSQSKHGERFILKGAMLFVAWEDDPHRHTRDIDFLGLYSETAEELAKTFRDVCLCPVQPDGLAFLADTITVTPIRTAFDFAGFRIELQARLGKSRLPMQIDVGFGDAVTPAAVSLSYPTLLDFPAPVIRTYRRETVIAEKLHAMAQHDLDNSRMKDLYDVRALAQRFSFDGPPLVDAIEATFGSRCTAIPRQLPAALGDEVARDPMKITQWSAFVIKTGVDPVTLGEVVASLRRFLIEPYLAAAGDSAFTEHWLAGGPWTQATSSGGDTDLS
jgi:Nucleotidyl transferase AbiEii toxin, Type IV TA system